VVLRFPLTVNEKAARVVAGAVALAALVALLTGAHWLVVPLFYGFLARVLAGPTLSPLAQLATRVVAPRLGPPRHVPGPPKRFAQGMGAAMTGAALVAWLAGATGVVEVLLLALLVAATLESAFAFCLGCKVFAGLMRLGVVPQSVCERCVV
jgi:Domain of unknown function (DUF4395)